MARKLAKKQPEVLRYEELEQRVLFSADLMPGLDADTDAVYEQVLVEDVAGTAQIAATVESDTAVQVEETRKELVFINENVADSQQLIDDLEQGDDNRVIEVVVLDADRDGIEQVSDILADRSDLAAVHFITHGADGAINLGSSWLNSITLDENSDAVAGWGNSLTETGDILFYGCNLAETEKGQDLTNTLAELTGADVAGSDDKTGHEDLGGDWELEYKTGDIEADIAVSADTQGEWHALLATAADDFTSGNYSGGSGWSSDWTEVGGDGSFASGAIQVNTNQLILADGETESSIYIYRTIDLSGATSATLDFDWGRDGESWDNIISVGISTDGSNWTQLMVLPDGGSIGTQHESINISGHISPTTYIRFVRGDWGTGDHQIDNVIVTYDGAGGNLAPTDLLSTATSNGGLSMNEDGGNDAYLLADDGGAILGGLTALTAEVRFSMESFPNSTNFFSYATGSDDNVFKFNIRDDGDLSVSINSIKINSPAMDFRTLADGEQHTLSVTWDSSGGLWEMFVDGVSVDSGSGLESGVTLAGGGALVIGNDQDSVDGGYDPAAEAAATIYDARIFNVVRSDIEIADNYESTLPNTESGMAANWTFNDLSITGVIADTVSGNNLTVMHASGGGFVPSAPALTLQMDEKAADGTIVGTLTGSDPEDDILTYSLLDDAGGRFAINETTGLITVANGSLLDYETSTTHDINVRVLDSSGNNYDEVLTITITPNDAPVLTSGNGLFLTPITEDETNNSGNTVAEILASSGADPITDVDAGAVEGIALTGFNSGNGAWEYNVGSGWVSVGTVSFTESLLLRATDSLRFVPDGLNADVASVTFEAWDQTSGIAGTKVDTSINFGGTTAFSSTVEVANITVTAVNDAPVATSDPGDYYTTITALNPVGYWQLNQTVGTIAVDYGSAANNGTYYGPTLGVSGAINGSSNTAVDFNRAESDYIEIAHNPAYLLDNGTVQLWFNADDLSVDQTLISKDSDEFDTGGHLHVTVLSTGEIEFRLQSNDAHNYITTPAGIVTAGNWYHVAVTFGDQGMQLYLDGELVGSNAYAGGLGTTSGGIGNYEPLVIGANTMTSNDLSATPLTEFFDGQIDEVALIGSQISAQQVKELYGAGLQLQDYILAENTTLNVSAVEGVLANDFDADGDALTATLVSDPSHAASFTLNADGSFDYTPTAGYDGTDSFTYLVNDGISDSSAATVTLTITGVNEAPVAVPDSTSYTNSVLDLNPLSYWRLGESSGTTAIDEGSGGNDGIYSGPTLGVTGALTNDANTAADFNGSTDYVDVGNFDVGGTGLTLTAWFNPDDFGNHDQRIISKANGTSDSDHTWMLSTIQSGADYVLRLRVNAGGTTNTLIASSGNISAGTWHHAAATYDAATGEMKLYLDGVEVGSQIHSIGGAVTTTAHDIYIGANPPNSDAYPHFDGKIDEVAIFDKSLTASEILALSLSDQANIYVVDEDNTLTINTANGVLANDSDAESDSLNAVLNTDVSNGTLTLNADGSFSYTPDADWSGTDSFTYIANDGALNSNIATVTITVNSVNDVPLAANDSDSTNEDTAITTGNVLTNDNLGDEPTSITSFDATSTQGGTVVHNGDGTFTYTPATNFNGTDTFTYTITDNDSEMSTATVTITVNAVNDAPVLTGANDLSAINEDDFTNSGTLISDLISGQFSDADTGALSGVAVVAVDDTNGTWEYTTDGSNWFAFGTVDASITRLLASDATTSVRFVPSADWNGTVTDGITFHAWDQTSGVNGGTADLTYTLRDEFTTASYSNNDGTVNWATDWIESDTGDSNISINAGQLVINPSDTGDWITREADLTNALSANLSFDYINNLAGIKRIDLQISDDGGSTFTTLATFSIDDNPGIDSFNADISSYIASNTQIRFYVAGSANSSYDLSVDNVQISYSINGTVGGSAAFSSDSAGCSITVNPVEDTPVITALQTFTVAESAANGVSLGSAVATDADTGTTFSGWTITAGNGDGIFAIDTDTGEITVVDNNLLDFETTGSYTLSLTVSDGTNTSAVETVDITVTDVATAITVAQSFSVAEDAVDTTAVGTVATTGDTPQTFAITAGNTGTAFAIDNSGNITVNDTLVIDYETLASYTLTIQVSDGTTVVSEDVTIDVTDVNENPVGAISDTDGTADSVAEDAGIGATVGITASASDPDGGDTVSYSLSDSAGGLFAIDSGTGVVTVNGALNAETAISHNITVVATSSDSSTSNRIFAITVTDVDEFNVGAVTDADATANTVAENAAIGSAVHITASATDADVDDDITYSLSVNPGGLFSIDGTTGIVTIANALDYESATSHSITVLATSDDGSTSNAVFTIDVTDVNDTAPVITALQTFTVAESAANGVSLGSAVATDADTGTTFSGWTITAGNGDGIFAIDTDTGEITVADNSLLDFETTGSYTLSLTVSDGTNTSAVETVDITVTDVATAITASQTFSVAEDAADTTAVGSVATTGDTPVSFTITLGNTGTAFAIDNSGNITVNDTLAIDYETLTSYTLTIQVSDGTTPVTETVTIDVTDVNDNAPLINDATTSIAEDAANATSVTNINEANTGNDTDLDGEALAYSITAGNGDSIFAINSSTGEITVTDNTNLDYETTQQYTLTVNATDGTNSDTATITVDVTNVNDNVPLINDATVSVSEDAANTTSVTNINEANTGNDTDLDGEALAYSITAGNSDNIFAINLATGEITVSDNTNLDYETTQQYVLTVEATDGTNSDTAAITIDVTNVNDNVPLINDVTTSVNEDAANTTSITNINEANTGNDTDRDGEALTYSITAGNADAIFAIDGATGEITVFDNTNLDFETTQQYVLTVQATDGSNTDTAAITIDVTNVNDNTPLINDATTSIAEDAANTTSITNINEANTGNDTDLDGETLAYSITAGNPDGIFAINSSTGEITVTDNTNLDYETTSQYILTVNATDGTNNDTAAITINVSNVNDNAPLINDATTSVNEDAINTTSITNINEANTGNDTDLDGEALAYSITAGNADGIFAIDANTGEITVVDNSNLDYETTQQYVLTVQASDGTNTDTAAVTIDVTNVNDNAPLIDDVTTSVAEDAANTTSVTNINDANTGNDTDLDGEALTYSITAGNGDGIFAINAATGEITVADNTNLDYEATSQYILTVEVSDGTNTDTAAITINVSNVNDNAPLINDATTSVNEDAINTTSVTNINEANTGNDTDLDGESLAYSITAGNVDGIFAIDANTGEITVTDNTNLDYETTPQYILTIEASDGSNTDTAAITIDVTNINDNAPLINDATTSVSENAANLAVVTNINEANTGNDTDLDGEALAYSITTGNADGIFAIDANTGEITVTDNTNLDYETTSQYVLTIQASDGTNTNTAAITVNVTDINESAVGAVSDIDAASDTVNENAIAGTTVGVRANATDPDSGDTVSYSLDDDAGGLFTIDNNTGIVTVAGILDAETATSHNITIRATSSDASFSTLSLSISINDVDEFNVGPVTDSNGIANTVAEDATTGAVVGVTALATDADITDNVAYSLTDNAGGRFAIDPNGGIITVHGALDYELNASHSVTVLATSSDGSTSQQIFTTNVTDVSEDVPVDDTPTTDPPIEDPDPIEDITPDDPTPEPDDPAEDPLLDEEPQNFEEITIIPDLTETDELIALEEDPTVELTEEIQDSVEELRLGNSQERPENDRSYSYFDNNLYKEVISAQHFNYQYQASENVLELDEFDDFGTIDFESNNLEEVIARGDYDLLRQEIDEAFNKQFKSEAVKTKIVTATAATFTVGIISYLLRAGSLAAALASSLPLWRGFDPIIVFTGDKKKEEDQNELSNTEELNADSFFEDDAE